MNPLISTYLISAMIGIMIFFTIALAPTVFKVLPQEWASKYLRSFFPKYYTYLGILCILASIASANVSDKFLLAICAVLFFFSLWVLTPAINRAAEAKQKKNFGLLHGLSVIINLIQIIVFVYLLS